MSKIYMIVEAQVDGQTLQSEKFNQLFNPDTEDVGFSEVFNMTDSKDFSDYEKKDDFINVVLWRYLCNRSSLYLSVQGQRKLC